MEAANQREGGEESDWSGYESEEESEPSKEE
jgi:hypothetical protein